ncbi:putative glycoside hydrolase, partial [Staphylococcus saprophyticus]|uniref:putative glycoside hydrolase n=1 Tax=Staphylococcus saprophyticus TaxID=29385 RepID=UPI0021B49514
MTQFFKTPPKHLKPYRAQISADVFRYSPMVEQAPAIPQTFPKIPQNTHPISSIIYPSHSTPPHFPYHTPHKHPYPPLHKYLHKHTQLLNKLPNKKPKSPPSLQHFTP